MRADRGTGVIALFYSLALSMYNRTTIIENQCTIGIEYICIVEEKHTPY
jgi:hypothetical protein